MEVKITVHCIIGDVNHPPNLPPGCRWGRQISPTVEPWRSEPIDLDEPGPEFCRESKTALHEGDEFECRIGGRLHRLTLRAVVTS